MKTYSMNDIKKVNIYASYPVSLEYNVIRGHHFGVELTVEAIRKCIMQKAIVDEHTPHGLVRLNLTNYNKDNSKSEKELAEEKAAAKAAKKAAEEAKAKAEAEAKAAKEAEEKAAEEARFEAERVAEEEAKKTAEEAEARKAKAAEVKSQMEKNKQRNR